MDKPLLNDKLEFPDDMVLNKYLGKTKAVWDDFVSRLADSYSSMALEWNFYNDGKAWLCKLVHKKKTVCWISVWDHYFRVTCYFTEKNDHGIKDLKIDQTYKDKYKSNQSHGKLKPLTIEVKTKKTLSDVFELIKYKSNLL